MKIEIRDKLTKESLDSHIVGRRFREFANLNDVLKKKFASYIQDLPEFPSRFTPFTPIDMRQEQLERYLSKLVEYPDIFEVLYFRKFIGLETRLLKENYRLK